MAIPVSTMKGAPVYLRPPSKKGHLLGYARRMYFEPGRAQVAYLQVQKRRWSGKKVLVPTDSTEWGKKKILIPLEKSVSVDTVDNALDLQKSPVYTSSGIFLGKVEELFIDEISLTVTQIEVVKRIFFMPYLRLLLGRQDILDITPQRIVVRDAVLREADITGMLLRGPARLLTTQAQQSRR